VTPPSPDTSPDPVDEPGEAFEQYDDEAILPDIDGPPAATDFGTTATEQLEGEPLDQRLRREVPEEQP
jgi:hypothetical protein